MSQNWYTCAECGETFHEDSISYCEKCDEHICDNCTTDKKPWRFIGEFEDILDNCPICAKDAKDAANPHKDFLGKALNEGDDVVYISHNCDRYTKWKITWFFKDQAIIQNQWMTTTKKMFKFIIKA